MNPKFKKKKTTRELILSFLKQVEHPEIALSLIELGMIIDVVVNNNVACVAIALPKENIPKIVIWTLEKQIIEKIEPLGLKLEAEYFDMTPENRNRFFRLANANWKTIR